MTLEYIEKEIKTQKELGYDYVAELIEKIYEAYTIELNEDTRQLLEDLLKFITIC